MKPQLLASLKEYKVSFLLNDILAGLMIAIIALPLSIALGIQSVPAESGVHGIQMGIITAIVGGFFVAALGGTRFQIGGPTAVFVVVVYNYIANPEIGLLGLQLAMILAGAWLIILAVFKAGRVIKYIPYPVIMGFTVSIGIILLVGQGKDFLGLDAGGVSVPEKLVSYAQNISSFNWPSLVIGAIGLAVILILQKISRKIPGALTALIVCTAVSLIMEKSGVAVPTIGTRYGEIKAGFLLISFSSIADVNLAALIVPSFVIAFLCMMESLLSATVADGITRTKHNSNTELMGQGVANILCSVLGGLPATGVIARTAANINSGARSPLAGMFHALFVLIMYFALMGIVKYIPMAVFAAILISVALNISNFPLFFKLAGFGRRDGFLLLFTCIVSIFFDITYGVIGGIALAFIVNIPNMRKKFTVEQDNEDKTVYILRGPLFFLNVNKLVSFLKKSAENDDRIVLDLAGVVGVDETATQKLVSYKRMLAYKGKSLVIANAAKKIDRRFEKYQKLL